MVLLVVALVQREGRSDAKVSAKGVDEHRSADIYRLKEGFADLHMLRKIWGEQNVAQRIAD